MTKLQRTVSRAALPLLLLCGVMSAAPLAEDLSRYRNFQLGTDLAAVAKPADVNASDAKVIHRRPALIQELQWRPQPLGPTSGTDPAKGVVFTFYNGVLIRIAAGYGRYQTEGLTVDDMVEAISAAYGLAVRPAAKAKAAPQSYDGQDEILAQWQDSQYRFDLVRAPSWPTSKLIGVLRKLEAPAQGAILEAARLDDQEAPQRDAERMAKENDSERVRLEQARLVNKPKFRP